MASNDCGFSSAYSQPFQSMIIQIKEDCQAVDDSLQHFNSWEDIDITGAQELDDLRERITIRKQQVETVKMCIVRNIIKYLEFYWKTVQMMDIELQCFDSKEKILRLRREIVKKYFEDNFLLLSTMSVETQTEYDEDV
ncbi:uncharacterized protein LOC119662298 [Teleopsis dalmanni]|uniref:uncharacterized protein LOC119662298 n=1 Tax=Teleopsis dalmanni TaxID=139649 RepID=UPI0018CDDF2F|nr:uncharacterized protein LOC119662298 [Teleopsis dalmanni]